MNFISNKKFYSRIKNIDSFALASIQNRSKGQVSTTVRANQTIEDNFIVGVNHTSSKKVSSTDLFSVNGSSSAVCAKSYIVEKRPALQDNVVLFVLTEGRGNAMGEIGLAAIDICTPVLILSQFSDNFMYSTLMAKVELLKPTEVLVPQTIYNTSSKALETIRKMYSGIRITPLPRRHFNSDEGLEMLKKYASAECKPKVRIYEKWYYAMTAAAALLKYLPAIRSLDFLKDSMKIEFQAKIYRMVIDSETCRRLELLNPLCETRNAKVCLLGILDRTVTVIGKRYLTAKILEPYFKQDSIVNIQQAIKEIHESSDDMMLLLAEALKKFYNVNNILKVSMYSEEKNTAKSVENMLDNILLLKNHLENIPELAHLLQFFKSNVMSNTYKNLTDKRFEIMLNEINKTLRPETRFMRGSSQCFQRIHAIRPGINDFLDMVRDVYNKLTDEIHELIRNLGTDHSIPTRMMYTIAKGFHIQVQLPKDKTEQINIPKELNLMYQKPNFLYLTSPELIKLNLKINNITQEIFNLSEKIVRKLLEDLMRNVDANYMLVETIANLDVIQSYAMVSKTDGYCCPNFGCETRVVAAVHPSLEYTKSHVTTVPNNIIATPEYNFYVITGPNMGGKTIYLKTIGVLQIMAQLGCYVPAKEAKFRLCDKLFTRMGFDDTIEAQGSGFINEIRDMEYIFGSITAHSLVLVDELCRSTNPKDAAELSWKFCEALCKIEAIHRPEDNKLSEKAVQPNENSDKAIKKSLTFPMPNIYITTHFMNLTKLKAHFFNSVNLHLSAEEVWIDNSFSIKYNHKVLEGVTPVKGYGLSLARSVGFPDEVTSRAHDILNEILLTAKKSGYNNANTSANKTFDELEKNLHLIYPNQSFQMELSTSAQQHVTSFMNDSLNLSLNQKNTTITDVKSKQLIEKMKYIFYDLYADLGAIYRQKYKYSKADLQEKVKETFESVKNQLPPEVITIIRTRDISMLLNESKNQENESQKSVLNKSHSNSTITNKTDSILSVENKNIIVQADIHHDFPNSENSSPKNVEEVNQVVETTAYQVRVVENLLIAPALSQPLPENVYQRMSETNSAMKNEAIILQLEERLHEPTQSAQDQINKDEVASTSISQSKPNDLVTSNINLPLVFENSSNTSKKVEDSKNMLSKNICNTIYRLPSENNDRNRKVKDRLNVSFP